MNHLFWGLFFCLLNYEVTVGTAVFGLIPDALGYFLLMKGMTALADESVRFNRGRHWAFGLCLVSVLLYGAKLMDPDTHGKVWLWILELAELLAMLVLLRSIIAGIGQMEKMRSCPMDSEKLKAMWLVLAVIQPLCHLVSWVPLVGEICSAASAATGLLFLIAFWSSRKKYCSAK